ncbi:M42 family metallopeptidase [Alicyclobacillus acidocaldarius]|uniref:Peptidase M42 family protein n=1 Tax=Alicyclobacillus acidocaldarius (strain Tc-4-1) TaxID=1048834 RepID=F8IJZ1_ALIAT|nr:M42 family metallopeptidase [Alicyclobacillus acidocaldarius]AEJ43503.1 peptidase M42 family protein [Alicyclobacillus acidocaldarius subsp. acidocaldarius Tc-4-1]
MLLKELTEAFGPTGFEDEVRGVVRRELDAMGLSVRTDVLGNVIASTGEHHPGPRVMLDAHMDEVGLMVTHIGEGREDGGLLRFRPLGGVDPRVLVSKPVLVGERRIPGVIGAKPVHLQQPSEREKPIPMEKLYIDIGARDADDARRHVKPGDPVVFATTYEELPHRMAKAKSFDDRVGCYILLEALRRWKGALPVFGAFTVQEEIGLRGAHAAAYQIQPDIAIALEGTVAHDVVGTPAHGQSTVVGRGPAITVQDGQTVANRRFAEFLWETAKARNIPVQWRRVKGGTNDFGAIHRVGKGVLGGAISVPVRYIHAPTQVVSLDDVMHAIDLVVAVLDEIAKGGFRP